MNCLRFSIEAYNIKKPTKSLTQAPSDDLQMLDL